MTSNSAMLVAVAGVILVLVLREHPVRGAIQSLHQHHHQNQQHHHPHRHQHHQAPHYSSIRHANVSLMGRSIPVDAFPVQRNHHSGRDPRWMDDNSSRINKALHHFKTAPIRTSPKPKHHRYAAISMVTAPPPQLQQQQRGQLSLGSLSSSSRHHSGTTKYKVINGRPWKNIGNSLRQRNPHDGHRFGGNDSDNIDDEDNDDDDDDEDGDSDDDYYYYDDDEKEDEEYSRVALGGDSDDGEKKRPKSRRQDHRSVVDYNYQDYPDDEPYNSEENPKGGTSLTDYKYQQLGTAEAVQESVRRHRPTAGIRDLAEAHKNMMLVEGKCSQPIPKVIAVPINDTSKIIVPHCTILHRCGNDTGCCFPHTSECVAKKTEDVFLHFYLIPAFNSTNRTSRQSRTIVVRHFINHTECHCVEKSSSDGFNGGSVGATSVLADQSTDLRGMNGQEMMTNTAAINEICRCPNHFDVMQEELGVSSYRRRRSRSRRNLECRCECLSNNQACLWLKDGHEGFTMEDRRCIKERICTAPICRYGDYDREGGRCPKPKNHKRTISRYDYG